MRKKPVLLMIVRVSCLLFLLGFVPGTVFSRSVADTCSLPASPEIKFTTASITLSVTTKKLLNAMAKKLKVSPACKLSVIAHGYSTYKAQQLGWDRIMTVMEYLYAKGIPEEQLIFSNGYEGNPNTVELVPTMEDGPHLVPPPYPPASKRKKTK